MRMTTLSPTEIREALRALPEWRRRGRVLCRTFEFPSFMAAIRFVNAVARCAERAGHHPDLDLRWRRVGAALTTHEAGGLTSRDFALAAAMDRCASRGPRRAR